MILPIRTAFFLSALVVKLCIGLLRTDDALFGYSQMIYRQYKSELENILEPFELLNFYIMSHEFLIIDYPFIYKSH